MNTFTSGFIIPASVWQNNNLAGAGLSDWLITDAVSADAHNNHFPNVLITFSSPKQLL